MEFIIYKLKGLNSLPYEELRKKFTNFRFEKESYFTEGKIEKRMSSNCKYGEIKIIIEINNFESNIKQLSWEVSKNEIPSEFFDAILTTIKNITKDHEKALKFRIVGGSYHPVDSSLISYEFATFNAFSNLIEFNNSNS